MSQRFEMEVAIDEELRSRETRRQIVLTPEVLCGRGKHGFGVSAVAPQFAQELQDTVQVGASMVLLFFRHRALALQAAEGFAHQVLDQNSVFLVCLVARCTGLKIKTNGT